MSDTPAAPNAPNAPSGSGVPAAPRPAALRAYVDERGVDVPLGGTALDAVRALDALGGTEHADGVLAGRLALTDSRGLLVDPAADAHGGAIYRLRPARPAPNAPDTPGAAEPDSSA